MTYKELVAYQVLSWIPPRVICWIGEEDHMPKEHCNILEDLLLHRFKDKANTDPEFLFCAQRQSIVFIHWSLMIQVA